MPKVGNTAFPYTKQGIAGARAESQKTGQPVKARQSYADVARATADKQRAAKKMRPPAEAPGEPAESAKEERGESAAKERSEESVEPGKSLGGSGVTIKDAIKHPGALTEKAKAAGQTIDEFAAAHKHDSDQTGQQARFYLGVLKKAGK